MGGSSGWRMANTAAWQRLAYPCRQQHSLGGIGKFTRQAVPCHVARPFLASATAGHLFGHWQAVAGRCDGRSAISGCQELTLCSYLD